MPKPVPVVGIVRVGLTAALIYLSYRETGPWTALLFVLTTASIEMSALIRRKERDA